MKKKYMILYMKSELNNKTVLELKEICKKKELKGYSKLCKDDLVKMLSKNLKKGGDNVSPCEKFFKDEIYNGFFKINSQTTGKPITIYELSQGDQSYIYTDIQEMANEFIKKINQDRAELEKLLMLNNTSNFVKKICKKKHSTIFASSNYKKCKVSPNSMPQKICLTNSTYKNEPECKVEERIKELVKNINYNIDYLTYIMAIIECYYRDEKNFINSKNTFYTKLIGYDQNKTLIKINYEDLMLQRNKQIENENSNNI